MSRRINTALTASIFLILTACAGHRVEVTEADDLTIDTLPSQMTSIEEVGVLRNEGVLIVVGKASRLHEVKIPGHMHISVQAPTGELLEQVRGKLVGFMSKRGGKKTARFSIPLKNVPPAGSRILVQYHPVGLDNLNS